MSVRVRRRKFFSFFMVSGFGSVRLDKAVSVILQRCFFEGEEAVAVRLQARELIADVCVILSVEYGDDRHILAKRLLCLVKELGAALVLYF